MPGPPESPPRITTALLFLEMRAKKGTHTRTRSQVWFMRRAPSRRPNGDLWDFESARAPGDRCVSHAYGYMERATMLI